MLQATRVTSAAALAVLCIFIAACSGKGAIPAGNNAPGPSGGNAFQPVTSTVPRTPQALSTNAPHAFNSVTIPNCSNCMLRGIAVGPDRLYYSAWNGAFVGSVSYAGVAGPQISVNNNPNGLAEGSNGGIYISNYTGYGLGELAENTFGGNVFGWWNDFLVGSSGTDDVISDPNGVIWFTESNNNSVVRMTTYGSLLSRTTLMAGSTPSHMTIGADNNSVYVSEYGTNFIAKLDLTGKLLGEVQIPQGHSPTFITTGPDGNVYFTEFYGDNCGTTGYLGKVTPSLSITMYPTADCGDTGIASASDGNIWFLEVSKSQITPFSVATSTLGTPVAIPSAFVHPYGLVSGADGQLWFTAQNAPYVASFQP